MTAVPWSAVFHDIYGGQWVYEQVADRTYARRRVEVGWIDDGWPHSVEGRLPARRSSRLAWQSWLEPSLASRSSSSGRVQHRDGIVSGGGRQVCDGSLKRP